VTDTVTPSLLEFHKEPDNIIRNYKFFLWLKIMLIRNFITIGLLLVLLLNYNILWSKDWYVRPPAKKNIIGDGRSYKTAFNGFDKIVWGEYGISGGDTLYCCGVFSESLKIKYSGSENKPILIKKIQPHPFKIDGKNRIEFGIINKGYDNIIIDGATISNCKRAGIYAQDKKGGVDFFEIKKCIIYDCKLWGVHIGRGSNYRIFIHDNIIYNCGDYKTKEKVACIGLFQWNTQHKVNDISVYRNKIYNSNLNGGHKENGIMVYHGGGKGKGVLSKVRIYENVIYGFDGIGVQIMMSITDIKCWDNLIYDCKIGYHFGGDYNSYVDGAEIWSTDPDKYVVGNLRGYPENWDESVGLYSDDFSKNILWHNLKVINVPGQAIKSHNNKSAIYACIFTYGNGKHAFQNKSKGGDTFLYNSTLIHNGKGAAVKTIRGSKINMFNCIVYGSGPKGLDGGRYIDYNLDYNIVYGFKNNYNDKIVNRKKNLELDPQFSNPLEWDYRFKSTSPCIGTGSSLIEIKNNKKLAKIIFGDKLNIQNDIGRCRGMFLQPLFNP
jgi:hypothetical protein